MTRSPAFDRATTFSASVGRVAPGGIVSVHVGVATPESLSAAIAFGAMKTVVAAIIVANDAMVMRTRAGRDITVRSSGDAHDGRRDRASASRTNRPCAPSLDRSRACERD